MPTDEAISYMITNDISHLLADAEVVREPRAAKVVTALRMDIGVQAEIERAASARGIGASTLMRQIIEEWVEANREGEPPDQIGELVRHLDAARRAADAIAGRAAAA
jgi:hypothetical protein